MSLLKIVSLLPCKDISTLQFSEIKKAILPYIESRKRLVIAERTFFLQMTQEVSETVVDFVARLNEAASLCQWELLAKEAAAQELVKLRFIAGLRDPEMKVLS